MHGERTGVSDGVRNRGSGGECNNQPLSSIDSGGNAVAMAADVCVFVLINWVMCSITLILYMCTSVKTVIVLHRLFNNTHYLKLFNLWTPLNKNCVLVSHQLYLHFKHLTKWEVKTLFKNPHEMAKKDDHPDLTGIFPVTPALANGVIFTSVTLK